MTNDGVLVDTSVLIDFLRGNEPNSSAVESLLNSKQIYSTGVVIAELLQGTRNEQEEAFLSVFTLDGHFKDIPGVKLHELSYKK